MKKKFESGQAIIMLVFAVIGLVGFTALAIDGGMVYSDRRHAQGASDAASLAGGGFAALSLENYSFTFENFNCLNPELNPTNSDPNSLVNKSITTAINRAISNDYTNAQVTITAVCEDNGTGLEKQYLDFTTEIIRDTNTALIHIVYDGPAINQVRSTVRVRPRIPFAFGNAIVALNKEDCQGQQNGATFHGNADIVIEGGGIWTNGCLRGNGGPDVDVTGGDITYGGSVIGIHLFYPTPQHTSTLINVDDLEIPEARCDDGRAHNVNANAIDGDLDPGLYCISGDVRINGNDVLTGTGVTLYLLNGGLTINGNATVQLTAPVPDPDPTPALPGM